ncbi:unnamed protein product [Blepharisma stoltei]|uniref:EF-hand domain-containing protein n=1 Tax=Blepharisma stoltei TaxID=1481888 RepID=A0AAU9J5X3_9CILI|nr:unnamed protein product [Blepharisma stoltei]
MHILDYETINFKMSEKPPSAKKKTTKKTKEKKSRSSSPTSEKSKSSPRTSNIPTSPVNSPKRAETIPEEPVILNICKTHSKEFKFFSETKEELACEDCGKIPGQSIIPIDQAHRFRIATAYDLLNSHLFQKRELLKAQAMKIQMRMDEIKRFKNYIEQDMKREFVAMNERLNSSYGSKMAVLDHDLGEVQSDLDRINTIVGMVENSNQNIIGFLQKAPELRYALDISVSKPFRTEVDVYAENLPQELPRIREITIKHDALLSLLKIKDEMIWNLTHEKNSKLEKSIEEELAEWVKLTDKFSSELDKFKLACEFCGNPLNENTINSNCEKSQRHHFVKIKDIEIPEEPVQDTLRNIDELGTIRQINQACRDRGLFLENIFRTYDSASSGLVSQTEFYQILSNQFGLSGAQINYFAKKYDPNTSGKVKYQLLLRDLLYDGSPLHSKLHSHALQLFEAFKKQDIYSEGSVKQETFKDILRSQGFDGEEIKQALSFADINSKGQVQYQNLYNRFK